MNRSSAVGAHCLVLMLMLGSVPCTTENFFLNSDTDHPRRDDVTGKLTPGCIEKYYQMYVNRDVPRRTYKYFHEDMELNDDTRTFEDTVKLQWRIVGGQQVDITEAPYTVLYGLYCGGVLIAPDWVITAAHCKTADNFIIAGSTKVSEGTQYNICAHYLHPMWSSPAKLHFHDYDYQLMMLETPVPVTARSRPIAIGRPSDITPGAMVSVTGWGHTQMKQRVMQNILRQVSIPIIPHERCREAAHKFYAAITPRMFCAGLLHNGTKDSCQGDSGGPAVLNNMLIGLVSFGVGCAEKEKPGVYSNVPLVRPWIREVTGLPL